jgi:hypothetical protein
LLDALSALVPSVIGGPGGSEMASKRGSLSVIPLKAARLYRLSRLPADFRW